MRNGGGHLDGGDMIFSPHISMKRSAENVARKSWGTPLPTVSTYHQRNGSTLCVVTPNGCHRTNSNVLLRASDLLLVVMIGGGAAGQHVLQVQRVKPG